jgi:hypothetical protein
MLKHAKSKIKEKSISIVYEVTIQQIKIQKHVSYSYHVCGDTRHKIIDCPNYSGMHNMFKNKRMKIAYKPYVVKPKVANPLVYIWDVNIVITKSKVTKV